MDPDIYNPGGMLPTPPVISTLPSTTCFICKEESPEGHRVHYGAEACYSCRAFFRRAHQKTKNPHFKCRKAGNCIITVKNRRKCQACRYELCLKAGMNPMYVLTDEQKKIRFRHSFQKKGKRGDGSDDEMMDETSRDNTSSKGSGADSPPSVIELTNEISQELDEVLVNFNEAFENFSYGETLLPRIVRFHQGDPNSVNLTDFRQYFTEIIKVLRRFASHHQRFLELPFEDQHILLNNNSCLFLQYIISRYVTSQTGNEQIEWLLGPQIRTHLFARGEQHAPINFQYLDESIDLFTDKLMMEVYRDFTEIVRTFSLSYEKTGVLANLILFTHNSTMELKDPGTVRKLWLGALNLATEAGVDQQNNLHLKQGSITETLKVMLHIFRNNTRSIDRLHRLDIFFKTEVAYTIEEELWLKSQLDLFDGIFRIVSCGDDLIREFIMLKYDVPLSKSFFQRSQAIFIERFRRVLQSFPEYKEINVNDQNVLWNINCLHACAMQLVRLETAESGEEQLHYILGELNANQLIRDTYGIRVKEGDPLRKVSLVETNKNDIDGALVRQIGKLIFDVANITRNQEMFKLLTMMILCGSDHEDMSKAGREIVREGEYKFMNILYRRLKQAKGEEEAVNMMSRIHAVKQSLQLLANYLRMDDSEDAAPGSPRMGPITPPSTIESGSVFHDNWQTSLQQVY